MGISTTIEIRDKLLEWKARGEFDNWDDFFTDVLLILEDYTQDHATHN